MDSNNQIPGRSKPRVTARTGSELCVFCLSRKAKEGEHVFPKSWYPTTTPSTVQRLTVPVCRVCADEFEKAERAFALPLLMGLDGGHPDMAGVADRLRRSWQCENAANAKDAKHRADRLRRMWREVQFVVPPADDLEPNRPKVRVRTLAGLHITASPAFPLERKAEMRIADKFVRGFHYRDFGRPLPATSKVEFCWAKALSPALCAELQESPMNESLAPGLRYWRFVTDPGWSLWLFRLWGQCDFCGIARPESRSGEDGPRT